MPGTKTENKKLLKDSIFEEVEISNVIAEADREDEYKLIEIEGIASRGGMVNRNGRLYPTELLTKVTNQAQAQIKKGKMLGNLDHPTFSGGMLKDVAIKFTDLWMEGTDMKFRGDVIPTDGGRQLEILLRSGVGVGMSTRGYGTTTEKKMGDRYVDVINDDYELDGIDAVLKQSNQAAMIKRFEQEGGGSVMDEKITLEQLKADHSDLVEELRKEWIGKERTTLEEEFEKKVKDQIEEAKSDVYEQAKKEVLESEEVKKPQDFVDKILESVKEYLPEDAQKWVENKDEIGKIEEMKSKLDEKDEKINALEKKIKEMEESIEAEERKKKIAVKVDELVKGQRFESLLRDRLKDCKTEEEVEERFKQEKEFIESITSDKEKPSGKGTKDAKKEDDDPTSIDEAKRKQQILAGIEEEGEK